MAKFYTSDLHFGHANIIKFDNRPFFSIREMEEALISNWNKVVDKNDEVYVLGDLCWRNDKAGEILAKLNGNKYLILGNHDCINSEIKKHFIWIKDYTVIKDGEDHVVLCHYPIAHWQNCDYGYIHLYGHIHSGRDSRPFEEYSDSIKARGFNHAAYNVGCMLHNYTPKTLKQLKNGE